MIVTVHAQTNLSVARIQRSFAGMSVALLLVAGLLSSPMNCGCGAGVPHGHSLFILGGHHHGVGQVYYGGAAPSGSEHNHTMENSPATGPQLTGRIMHGSDRLAVALPNLDLSVTTWERFTHPATLDELGDGRVESPESPPPRSIFQNPSTTNTF